MLSFYFLKPTVQKIEKCKLLIPHSRSLQISSTLIKDKERKDSFDSYGTRSEEIHAEAAPSNYPFKADDESYSNHGSFTQTSPTKLVLTWWLIICLLHSRSSVSYPPVYHLSVLRSVSKTKI